MPAKSILVFGHSCIKIKEGGLSGLHREGYLGYMYIVRILLRAGLIFQVFPPTPVSGTRITPSSNTYNGQINDGVFHPTWAVGFSHALGYQPVNWRFDDCKGGLD